MSEEFGSQHTFDKLTRMDEALIAILQELRTTNTLLRNLPSQPGGPPTIEPRYDATFPSSGVYSFPAGRTAIDLKTGIVKFPDSPNLMYMSHSLQSVLGRSIDIRTEGEVSLVLYENDRVELSTAVFPWFYRKTYLEFNQIEITTTKATNIWLTVSSEPEGAPEMSLATFKEGNPYITHGTIVVPGTPTIIDVRSALGRNAHDGHITNAGVGVGVLYVFFNNGAGYTADYEEINPFGEHVMINEDVALLMIDTDVAGTQYRLFMS